MTTPKPGAATGPRGEITVTGGAGYIGRNVVARLLDGGWDVRVLDLVEDAVPEGARFFPGDVRDGRGLGPALEGVDAVVHLAGLVAADADPDPELARAVNEAGTSNVLDACRGAGVSRFVFASTFLVYTGALDEAMDETCAIDDDRLKPFARSKRRGEALVQEWGRLDDRHRYVTLRIGSVYGPGGGSNVIRTFVEDALEGREVEVWGMGRRQRPLIYVGDVAAAVERSLLHLLQGVPSGLFNCVGERSYSTREVLDELQRVLPAMQVTYKTEKPESVGDVCPSAALAGEVLGWRARMGLDEGLRRTVAWFRGEEASARAAGGVEGE